MTELCTCFEQISDKNSLNILIQNDATRKTVTVLLYCIMMHIYNIRFIMLQEHMRLFTETILFQLMLKIEYIEICFNLSKDMMHHFAYEWLSF